VIIFKRKIPKIGLALGGGGARGLAHIGVLKVLEREKIPINIIAGTSMGSIVGAMYAQLLSAVAVEKLVLDYLRSEVFRRLNLKLSNQKKGKQTEDRFLERMFIYLKYQYVFNRSYTRMSLFNRKILDNALKILLENIDIRDTKIPFAAVATDILSGEDVVLREGPIREAVAASSSIPGMFPPVEWNGFRLIDGGVINIVPVWETLEMGADLVISVDVTRTLVRPKEFRNGLEIMFRADEITNYRLNMIHLKDANVIIQPQVGNAHWANFSMVDKFIMQGKKAAEEKIDEINNMIQSHSESWFSKLLVRNVKA
jgi:NTE family protein